MPRVFPYSIVLLLCSFSCASSQDSAEIVAKAEESLLKIEVEGIGQGSGFVVDSNGIAVTNVHVMAGATNGKARASFPDGKVCEITGSYHIDKDRDIAVIQLKLDSLPELPLAAALPRKGEEVLALGSPMGLSFTATRGIISAIRAESEMQRDLDDSSIKGTWVQVDAPLSPGNSGGPLINKHGELVAMSTKASVGQAQNLNFGISVEDIREAIDLAKGKPLVNLSAGLGKIDMEDEQPKSGIIVERKKVPPGAIREYVQRGKDNFSVLAKGMRRELVIQKDELREMKAGRIDFSLQEKIAREDRTGKYYFGNEGLKNIIVTRQEERVSDLNRKMQTVGRAPTNESLMALLANFGPALNIRERGSVGFLSNARVVKAVTEKDVIISYQGNPYLLWVPDTSGLADGEPVTSAPVYVVGSKTLTNDDGQMLTVTLLYTLTDAELKDAIFESTESAVTAETSQPASDRYRKWRDNTGKFEIEAKLVTKDTSKVVLQRKDGSVITVPFSKLSDSDRKYLQTN